MSGLTVIDYMEEVASRALGNPATDRCEPSSARVFTEQAAAHTQMGRNLAPQERMRWAKKLVLRVAHLFSKEQVVFNEKTVDALREVDATLRAAHQQSAAAQLRASLLDERIDTLERDGLGGVRSAIDGIARSLEGIARTQEAMRAELSMVRSRLRSDANEALTPALLRPQTNEDGAIEEESLDSLYMNFEHRFRGSSIDIKERQRAYLPEILPAKHDSAPFLDIGPGRGEWLELLREHGVPAYGVEINETFVERGRQLGLDVRRDEALAHLRGLADSSLAAITAFQVAEHVDNRSLMALIDQALRVLRPQGLLLLETPNPRNLVVGATTFWIDPTHVRPLPPDLLSFLLEERGFGEVHVVYGARPPVEEFAFIDNDTADQQKLNRLIGFINETFFGAQDYAVIGRKPST